MLEKFHVCLLLRLKEIILPKTKPLQFFRSKWEEGAKSLHWETEFCSCLKLASSSRFTGC